MTCMTCGSIIGEPDAHARFHLELGHDPAEGCPIDMLPLTEMDGNHVAWACGQVVYRG